MNALVQTNAKTVVAQAGAVGAVEEKQYLTFMLGGEMFSLSILCIKEIIWYANLTEVPMMPACIRGVINLRGAVVPVMDLSNRFGKPSTPVVKSTCIVIVEVPTAVEGEHQNMGVVVDSVQAVLEIPTAEIEPAPSFGARIRSEFIEGIAKVGGKFVILLNVAKVLSMEEIGQMGQVAAMAELEG
ncbi:MAG: chemotaxis protein CheW [Rhodoferax sp.]|uniref:chemotaxis protein CheW n=1 Tax=Rhodoferax sp. TaxID=50421 RepID=UPI0008B3CAC6|nr:chemotaxis protein CheW [Rhodoferax sp.]MDP2680025.1 chemotaxis protein CheW [Rhodoferax sp.]OGB51633.1 MAG: chemotaxis protein CheW [Burkholderiales bacterium RIFOXYD12_FULL_59_19]OGB81242.1 MAG: chemotaxis protein CheW [Burkholderiales bacterium RIFOXYC12_FULL_60_6]